MSSSKLLLNTSNKNIPDIHVYISTFSWITIIQKETKNKETCAIAYNFIAS